MAGFRTHITTSSVLGIGYGAAAYFAYDMPPATCVLAAGLCGVAGMLPDVDSDSGVPLRETMAFGAAVVPMLMIDRFQHMGLSTEWMILAAALIYVFIRFGVAEFIKRYTVHRGMWHSLPAAAIAGLLTFLVYSREDLAPRLFVCGGVVLGFLSHLLLDELWSIELSSGRLGFKKSFGTAIKLWSKSRWANLSTYGKLMIVAVMAVGDPFFMERCGFHEQRVEEMAWQFIDKLLR
jgi:membrane-bound metal-dependent hydrolase YbcI (DUF457 family)